MPFFDLQPTSNLRGLQMMAFTDVGHVGTRTVVDDSGGGAAFVWTYGGSVPCRLDTLAADERYTGGRINERSTHLVTAPANTAVDPEDRFVIDGRGTYEITSVRESTGWLPRFFEVTEIT